MTRSNHRPPPSRRHALATWLLVALLGLPAGVDARTRRDTPVPEHPNVLQGTVIYVIDGDTLVLRPRFQSHSGRPPAARSPYPLRIRLAGIDAPELCQRGGGEARSALAEMVSGQAVSVTTVTVDRYGRVVGRLTLDAEDVAARLVAQGLAWSGDSARYAGPYGALEDKARSQHRGVFADDSPTRPKDFRREHGACPHAPGSRLKHFNQEPP